MFSILVRFICNRAHPHRLIGKDRKANKGIYTLEMNDGIMTAILSDLTIQYVKMNDIGKSLNERAQIKVDPFNSKNTAFLFNDHNENNHFGKVHSTIFLFFTIT